MLLSNVLDGILPELPEIVLMLANDKILSAAREYCEEGNAWLMRDMEVNIEVGVTDYTFTLPSDSELVRVLNQDDNNFIPITENEISKAGLSLLSSPATSGTIKLTIAIKPTSVNADMDVPDDKAIEYGALFHCKRMTNVTWSDKEGAAYYRREFNSEIVKAKQQAWHGNQGGTVRVRPRKFV